MIAFGPIPSRRLGRSLGINNIPPKRCSYACVYCQVGRTSQMRIERGTFFAPDEIVRAVEAKVAETKQAGESIDYLTFVPDGEPTLDIHLGQEIECLRPLGIKIAVITNASLIWREDVREALLLADWVSLKMDAVEEAAWRKVDRPHGRLNLDAVLKGALAFARAYQGELVTETMLVAGVNDGPDRLAAVAQFLARLRPARAYLSIPTRPPTEPWARPPDEDAVNRAYQVLDKWVDCVEYLIGYEGSAFAATGDAAQDLLGITAVHPMREEAVGAFLDKAGADWSLVEGLIAQGQLARAAYEGHAFYLRKLASRRDGEAGEGGGNDGG